MLGQLKTPTTTKPSRSDEIVDPEEQIRIANHVRSQFDAVAPKRPIKPSRSDPDTPKAVDSTVSVQNIPELDKFQSLQSHPHMLNSQAILSSKGVVDAQDEFVETEYYKELASIDKQHHTTGDGFIKAVREGGEDHVYEIKLPVSHVDGVGETQLRGYKTNPAINDDWVPNLDEHQLDFNSSKPNRSEST